MKTTHLKLTITLLALGIFALRHFVPNLKVDAIALALLALAVLPWLSSIIKSAEFPGGWKVEFQDVQSAGEKVTRGVSAIEMHESLPQPAYSEVVDRDPNLHLLDCESNSRSAFANLPGSINYPRQDH